MIKINLPDYSLEFNVSGLQEFRDDLQLFPGGIYFLFNDLNECIYIGKSKNLYARLLQHRRGRFSKELEYIKVIYEDNPSYRDILETYAIMTFDPKYNLDKVYKDNEGESVRDDLSGLFYEKEELEISLYELKDKRRDLVKSITPPVVQGTYNYFGDDSETDNRRYRDSLEALFMFRETYDIDNEYDLLIIEKEIEEYEYELDRIKSRINELLEGLKV